MQPLTKYFFFLLLCLVVPMRLVAQDINLTGTWRGMTGSGVGGELVTECYIEQRGTVLAGWIKYRKTNGKDSSKVVFSGKIEDSSVIMRSTSFEYNTTSGCLGVSELTYSQQDGQDVLEGRWHGEVGLSTCPVYISGKVELKKEVSRPPALTRADNAAPVVRDELGNTIITELRHRKYYALIIGIDQYQDDALQDLDNPVSDARRLMNVLEKNYTFDAPNVTFLANPTRSVIIEAFDKLTEQITDRDQLLIFYAGHGIWDDRLSQGFWLPSDARATSKAQWLSNSTIRDYIGGIQSKHTLLITDACFSGSIFKERGATLTSRAILELYKLPSRKAMTSGTLKTVPDKSVFITYLVKNLENNEHPLLSAEELFRTFKIAVINNSPNSQVPQYGPIGQAGDEGGDFIFLKRE